MTLCRDPAIIGHLLSANPKGIPQQSPGLRGTSYPGIMRRIDDNPEGVAAHGSGSATRPQPRWGCEHRPPLPRVARPSQPWALLRNPFGILSSRRLLQFLNQLL